MLHVKRTWCIVDVNTPEELARNLHQPQPLCQGFRLGKFLYLNDSANGLGLVEYAVIQEKTLHQAESLTTSWWTDDVLIWFACCFNVGIYDKKMSPRPVIERVQLQTPEEHLCRHCRREVALPKKVEEG